MVTNAKDDNPNEISSKTQIEYDIASIKKRLGELKTWMAVLDVDSKVHAAGAVKNTAMPAGQDLKPDTVSSPHVETPVSVISEPASKDESDSKDTSDKKDPQKPVPQSKTETTTKTDAKSTPKLKTSGTASSGKRATSTSKTKKVTKKTKKKVDKEKDQIKTATLEDELAEQLTPDEIVNFQIERVDMEKLTHKVCDILIRSDTEGMLQADLYKKLKLSARNGARLSLKLERTGVVVRTKLLVNGRWTYKLTLKKMPVSTESLTDAPCLVCPVEQRCSLEGEISPRTCGYIEDWVIAELKRKPK